MDEIWDLIGSVSEGFPTYFYLQLYKANASDSETPFLNLHLHVSISKCFFSSKIYDKRDDFDFCWMGTFPVLPLTVLTYLNLFDLLEGLVM